MGNVLIERLQNVFGTPDRVEKPEAFVAEVHRITAGFSPEALDQAASALIGDGGKSWPAPKAIVQACVDAQEALTIRRGGPAPKDKFQVWLESATANSEKWAREFCKSTEVGERAFNEGWGRNLYLWAKNYAFETYRRDEVPNPSRRPTSSEIEYWVRYCLSPPSWLELERVTYLREPFSAETNARLNRVITVKPFALPTFKQMPTEDDDAA